MNQCQNQSTCPDPESLVLEIATRARSWDPSVYLGLLPDPDPVLKKRGGGVSALESLLADAHLVGVIQTRKLGTLKKQWRFEPGRVPGGQTPPETKQACLDLTADLSDMDLYSVLSALLDAPYFGFTPVEIIWEPGPERLRIKNLRALPQRWFGFDAENRARFLSKDNPWQGEDLPPCKFILARHFPTYDNPYGLRLLSRCFWPVTFKRGGLKFWVTFAERYGMPLLIGKYRPGAPDSEQQDMLTKLSNMVQDAVAVIPEGNSVDLVGGAGNRGGEVYERLKTAMDAEMSKVIMGQTLTAEVADKGTYAASKTHERVLDAYQEADARLVETAMNQVARIYAQLNTPGAPAPRFRFHEEDEPGVSPPAPHKGPKAP